MAEEVRGSDFTDVGIRRFFDSIRGLKWQEVSPTDAAIRREAEAFAQSNPKPDPDQLRSHIDHAVAIARGWDHPHDPDMMLETAVKSFYTLAWLEHLQERSREGRQPAVPVDLNLAVKITFTPVFSK